MHANRFVKKRKNYSRHGETLEARKPGLINLPIPLPSIPVVQPLLSPLIGGSSPSNPNPPLISLPPILPPPPAPHTPTQGQSSPTPPPAQQPPSQPPSPQQPPAQPAPPAQQAPPQQAPPDSSSPPTGGSNNDGSSQSPPANTSGGGSSSNDAGQSNSSNNDQGESSSASSSGSGTSNNSPNLPPPGQGSPSSPSPPSQEPPVGGGDAGPSSLPSEPETPVVLPSGASIVSGSTFLNGTPLPTQNAIANAGSPPPTGIVNGGGSGDQTVGFMPPGTTGTSTHSGGVSGSSGSGSGNGSGSNGGGGDSSSGGDGTNGGDSPNIGSGSAASGHHGLSSAAIAALVVVAMLVLIGILFVVFRRRSIRKSLALRNGWFQSKGTYGATGLSSSGYFRNRGNAAPTPSRSSVRSSFGTSYEHDPILSSTPPPMPLGSDWPLYNLPAPEMTQAVPSPVMLPPATVTTSTPPSPTIRGSRNSTDSLVSLANTASDGSHGGQVLQFPEHHETNGSPFSLEVGSPLSVRPFSPTERWSFPMPPSSREVTPRSSANNLQTVQTERTHALTPNSDATSDFHTAREDDSNPFADSAAVESVDAHTTETFVTADTETGKCFSSIEVVNRPFVPTLPDEIAANPGDRVHMLRKFDDGWGYAENLNTGKRGLFPIDCLREPEQDLPAFLAAKRLSSYTGIMPLPPVMQA